VLDAGKVVGVISIGDVVKDIASRCNIKRQPMSALGQKQT
jgi:CBS domain-containing protein